ncbi:MAG: hypothetical protein ACYS1A_20545 [Planctomycetota bacterium]|jgi:hypothetical protein
MMMEMWPAYPGYTFVKTSNRMFYNWLCGREDVKHFSDYWGTDGRAWQVIMLSKSKRAVKKQWSKIVKNFATQDNDLQKVD